MTVDQDSKPRLWRLARISFDKVRQRRVLLYPEGAMFINETGAAILELCNGAHTVQDIARTLGERYGADVQTDVLEYLTDMARRDLVTTRG